MSHLYSFQAEHRKNLNIVALVVDFVKRKHSPCTAWGGRPQRAGPGLLSQLALQPGSTSKHRLPPARLAALFASKFAAAIATLPPLREKQIQRLFGGQATMEVDQLRNLGLHLDAAVLPAPCCTAIKIQNDAINTYINEPETTQYEP